MKGWFEVWLLFSLGVLSVCDSQKMALYILAYTCILGCTVLQSSVLASWAEECVLGFDQRAHESLPGYLTLV